MLQRTCMLVITLACLLTPGVVAATTILVPSGQPTIQQGINVATEGDTVLVASGTYTGSLNRDLDFGGTNLSLISESGQGFTDIDCDYLGRGFFFHSGEDTTSVVRGFSITNAVADTGAGAYCVNGSSPRFEECTFTDNTAQNRGGGLRCDASSPIVRYCEFSLNVVDEPTLRSAYGGGMCFLSGSSPLIVDTDFIENLAYGGGGIYSNNSSPQLVRCDFTGNLVEDYGVGGGVMLNNSDGAVFTDCGFWGNGVATCVGGAIRSDYSAITVTDCVFVDNISGTGGGLRMSGANSTTVTGCTFIGNTGSWSAAGAIQCLFDASPTITNCTIVGNGKHQVWCQGASPTLEYCILAFAPTGLAVLCDEGTETPSISHCFVFGNAEGDSLCGGNYHDNEYVNPLLCDWEMDDVTLCADSPCLPGATWPSLVGAQDAGCAACGTAVEEMSWGVIKAMYLTR